MSSAGLDIDGHRRTDRRHPSVAGRSAHGRWPRKPDQREEARELYQKLRRTIAPLYYQSRDRWIDVMRHTIAFNAAFFNTHRMVQQYAANAYV